ncbi:hypothetical protein [Anaerostipes sp.]|uniref:hypothetical protein n=1 Tax=Anaerostipes sp. TaxID=1872530 RepID=UPI0025C1C34C|nr:hypothetical protein [Anaerostipes sp.]MBS7006766.1 hypothetical protein [Anaerostipes sp.]
MSFCENIWDSDQEESIKIKGGTIENIMRSGTIDYVQTTCFLPESSKKQSVVIMIVDDHTLIHCSNGKKITSKDLKEGMMIDAWVSMAMTRSIPPQTRAYRIIVKSSPCGTALTNGKVAEVDLHNNFLYTGIPGRAESQIRFVVTEDTPILDRRGSRIRLRDLRQGDRVRVEHADFMTASIPPQTNAFMIQRY